MAEVKRFSFKKQDPDKEIPFEFEVPIVRAPGEAVNENAPDTEVMSFHAKGRIPGFLLMDVISTSDADTNEPTEQARALRNFLENAVVERDHDRLVKTLRRIGDMDELVPIIRWLIEQYGTRPTQPA